MNEFGEDNNKGGKVTTTAPVIHIIKRIIIRSLILFDRAGKTICNDRMKGF